LDKDNQPPWKAKHQNSFFLSLILTLTSSYLIYLIYISIYSIYLQ
jgi:hypothetical protein